MKAIFYKLLVIAVLSMSCGYDPWTETPPGSRGKQRDVGVTMLVIGIGIVSFKLLSKIKYR